MKKQLVMRAALFNTRRVLVALALVSAGTFHVNGAERMVLAEDFTFQQ